MLHEKNPSIVLDIYTIQGKNIYNAEDISGVRKSIIH